MAALAEVWNARRVQKTHQYVRVTRILRGAKADFSVGANGWTATGMPDVGDALSISGMTWGTQYATPICAFVDQNVRFTSAAGFVRAVYEGERLWVD